MLSYPHQISFGLLRRMRWAGHAARLGTREVHTGFWCGDLREEDHLEYPGVDGSIVLNGSSGSGMWGYGLDRAGSGQGQVAGTCECDNEPSSYIKCRGIAGLAEKLLATHEGLCFMELVS